MSERPSAAKVLAPAKVNLCLHVTGRRDDGYHLIDSLVSFAAFGDCVDVTRSAAHSLHIEGPEARGVPADMQNLALRAAALVAGDERYGLTLTKNLPAASGIGGGSADAAAALRGILAMNGAWIVEGDSVNWPGSQPLDVLSLGADVPMCLFSRPSRVRGIGERVEFLPLVPLPAVLVNPRVPVSTAEVFSRLERRDNPPLPAEIPAFKDTAACIHWLSLQRNDLEHPAMAAAPVIADVLAALSGQAGCGLARMSGSGATCFGLFSDAEAARAASERLATDHPGWWVAEGPLGNQQKTSEPKLS